MGTQKER
ncbi:hypothetical protein ZOSMA_13G00100, partial [Zostera marina]